MPQDEHRDADQGALPRPDEAEAQARAVAGKSFQVAEKELRARFHMRKSEPLLDWQRVVDGAPPGIGADVAKPAVLPDAAPASKPTTPGLGPEGPSSAQPRAEPDPLARTPLEIEEEEANAGLVKLRLESYEKLLELEPGSKEYVEIINVLRSRGIAPPKAQLTRIGNLARERLLESFEEQARPEIEAAERRRKNQFLAAGVAATLFACVAIWVFAPGAPEAPATQGAEAAAPPVVAPAPTTAPTALETATSPASVPSIESTLDPRPSTLDSRPSTLDPSTTPPVSGRNTSTKPAPTASAAKGPKFNTDDFALDPAPKKK